MGSARIKLGALPRSSKVDIRGCDVRDLIEHDAAARLCQAFLPSLKNRNGVDGISAKAMLGPHVSYVCVRRQFGWVRRGAMQARRPPKKEGTLNRLAHEPLQQHDHECRC